MAALESEVAINLLDLSDDAFNSMVNQDVRGTLNSELSQLLRDPAIADRWYETLVSLKRSVEAQLSANRAEQVQKQSEFLGRGPQAKMLWLQTKATTEKWRAGAVRFKNGVEDRMAEARRNRDKLRLGLHVSVVINERDVAFREVKRLRSMILSHRDHECDENCEPNCAADDSLWNLLDNESVLG